MTDKGWDVVQMNGMTLKDAVTEWYEGESVKTSAPCLYSETPPYQCNPTCPPALVTIL